MLDARRTQLRKTRWVPLLMVLALAAAACGGGGGEEPAATEDGATAPAAETGEDTAAEAPAELKPVRVIFGAGALTPMLAGQTAGIPLGYYEQEGLELDIVAAAGGGTSMQALAAGEGEYAIVVAAPYISAFAESGDLGIIDACNQTAQIHWQIWVPPGSDIEEFEDLVGSRVGVISFGDSEYVGIRQTMELRGLNPDQDVEIIAVDQGASAGQALEAGEVDALAMWDGAIATIRELGYEMERIPNPPEWENLFGFGFGVRKDYLEENRDEVAAFCRAASKGEVFTMTNPEDAVRLHWEVSPESRPEGNEEEALETALAPLQARIPSWTPCGEVTCEDGWSFGWHNSEHWEATVEFVGVEEDIPDASVLYTNELVDDINDFDLEAVVSEAENFDFESFSSG